MQKFVLLLLIGIAMATFSLADEKGKKEEPQTQTQSEAIVTYEVIQQGTYSGLKEVILQVVQTSKDWEEIWKKHVSMLVPQPPVPTIDFQSYVVVVIAVGEKRTSGYGIVLKDVAFELKDVVVKYHLTEPPANSFTLQVLTQPYLMLKIQKPEGTVKAVKE